MKLPKYLIEQAEAKKVDLNQVKAAYNRGYLSWSDYAIPGTLPYQLAEECAKQFIQNTLAEDRIGAEYNADANGSPSAQGGLGTAFTANVYKDDDMPPNKSIKRWMANEETQRNYHRKYGSKYPQHLKEAAWKLHESISK